MTSVVTAPEPLLGSEDNPHRTYSKKKRYKDMIFILE